MSFRCQTLRKNLSEINFQFHVLFIPKRLIWESRRFIWADGKEHPEYYNISVPNSSLNFRKTPYNVGDICLSYFNKISTQRCGFAQISTFIICEYA
ncbi:hypothetical protein Anas_13695 [Armadillidium nasatum]|uniref:Uncharacterized protein n=1 Tax=Armadillidium nasatum TaxID=96803 RepID=A0A5N5T3K1_9CRUS|nr:hypothetical protein Anas_13695 [Armadillidium nasatum]